MIYFINNTLKPVLSAIELTEMERVSLLEELGFHSQILTRDYDRFSFYEQQNISVPKTAILNMMDFFQQAKNKIYADLDISRLTFPDSQQVEKANGSLTIRNVSDNRITEIIYFREFANKKLLNYVAFYDRQNKLTSCEFYDVRGFKSLTQFYGEEGHPNSEIYWSTSGKAVLINYFRTIHGSLVNTQMRLLNDLGPDYYFNSVDALFSFFLDQLCRATKEKDILIVDRQTIGIWPLSQMKTEAYKFLQLHSTHTINPQDSSSSLTYWVKLADAPTSRFDGFIVSTEQQKRDLAQQTRLPVYVIPVGYIKNQKSENMYYPSPRKAGNVVVVSRLSEEKNIADAIRAISILQKQSVPIHLDIYGAPMAGHMEEKKLHALVDKLQVNNIVSFKGFYSNLSAVYRSAQVLLITSKFEGFNRACLEALSNGVPVVAYDVNYGPSAMIENGINGYLVPFGDVRSLANRLANLLDQNAVWQMMNLNTTKINATYSETKIKSQWKNWLNSLHQNNIEK